MPNIAILRQQFPSGLLEAVAKSNTLKQKNLGSDGWADANADHQR
jgi:hypothetical protein